MASQLPVFEGLNRIVMFAKMFAKIFDEYFKQLMLIPSPRGEQLAKHLSKVIKPASTYGLKKSANKLRLSRCFNGYNQPKSPVRFSAFVKTSQKNLLENLIVVRKKRNEKKN